MSKSWHPSFLSRYVIQNYAVAADNEHMAVFRAHGPKPACPLPARFRHKSPFGLGDFAVANGANGVEPMDSFPPF